MDIRFHRNTRAEFDALAAFVAGDQHFVLETDGVFSHYVVNSANVAVPSREGMTAAEVMAILATALALMTASAGVGYSNTTSGLTATNVQAAIDEINTSLSGLVHTAITNIDLQATANLNEFTVVITWTDEDGATQTTTDATPITVNPLQYTTTAW